jgi:uncharacterized protein (DUF697 family)
MTAREREGLMADKSGTAEQLIREHVIWSVGAGLVPVPVVDFVAVTAIQLDLIRQLSTLHGVSYEEGTGKIWIGALTGGALARIGASAIKAIPGIGSLIGGLSMSIASGASTYGVGKVVHRHFENGGTMGNLDVDEAKSRYETEYEKGKEVAKKASDKGAKDVFEKLEKLGELKKSGVITDAEFEKKKSELLAQL